MGFGARSRRWSQYKRQKVYETKTILGIIHGTRKKGSRSKRSSDHLPDVPSVAHSGNSKVANMTVGELKSNYPQPNSATVSHPGTKQDFFSRPLTDYQSASDQTSLRQKNCHKAKKDLYTASRSRSLSLRWLTTGCDDLDLGCTLVHPKL